MWWRSVNIGSLTFSSWSAVNEEVSLEQIQRILQTTSPVTVVVIKSLEPLEIAGIIFRKTAEKVIGELKEDKLKMQQPAIQVDGLISTNFTLMPISGGVIGDLEESFGAGSDCIILYRSVHVLSVQSNNTNNNGETEAVERKKVIAGVTRADLKRWIGEVEGHHNMHSLYENLD